jgi:signal transduction histidine kinase
MKQESPSGLAARPGPVPGTQAMRGHPPSLLRVLASNAAVAVVIGLILGIPQLDSQIYSQAIGWSICLLAVALSRLFGAKMTDGSVLLAAVPLGCAGGLALGTWITGDGLLAAARHGFGNVQGKLAFTLLVGAGMAYYFFSRSQLAQREAQLKEAELRQARERQRSLEAQWKMLQAQIEPHFLFNTLSNIVGQIDERPQAAKDMLVDLTRLLRRSLLRARSDTVPLAEDVADVRAYLEIQAQRLGVRLRYAIEMDPALGALPVPPYLLQPLVENAIRHGLEPTVEGGALNVRASLEDGELRIEVADTGRGLCSDHPPGVALANIRERLAARYGPRAHLSLHPNSPGGVVARITLPAPPACAGHAALP